MTKKIPFKINWRPVKKNTSKIKEDNLSVLPVKAVTLTLQRLPKKNKIS